MMSSALHIHLSLALLFPHFWGFHYEILQPSASNIVCNGEPRWKSKLGHLDHANEP